MASTSVETELTRVVVVNQRSYEVPRDVWREIEILRIQARASLANNLCPDHRDKQAGKPCLACTEESLTLRVRKLEEAIRNYEGEYTNPVPDYGLRRIYRNRLFALSASPEPQQQTQK